MTNRKDINSSKQYIKGYLHYYSTYKKPRSVKEEASGYEMLIFPPPARELHEYPDTSLGYSFVTNFEDKQVAWEGASGKAILKVKNNGNHPKASINIVSVGYEGSFLRHNKTYPKNSFSSVKEFEKHQQFFLNCIRSFPIFYNKKDPVFIQEVNFVGQNKKTFQLNENCDINFKFMQDFEANAILDSNKNSVFLIAPIRIWEWFKDILK